MSGETQGPVATETTARPPDAPGPYDLVIHGGRVMDPESGFDGICDVGVRDGRIVGVAQGLEAGTCGVAAAGLVVAPGFIDLHAHGQSVPADRMQAFDGVTTALELELGALPVAAWYERQAAAGRVINYGGSVAWLFARITAMTGVEPESSISFMGRMTKDRRWADNVASDTEVGAVLARIRTGLDEGGIGIGLPNAYAPGSGVREMSEVCSLAAANGAPTFTHIAFMSNIDPQSSIEAYTRLIGYAGSTGAHMHICHFNSTSLQDVERAAVLVHNAQRQGLKVTVEAYPYGTGSTVLGAVFFKDPNFPQRTGAGVQTIEMVDSGRRFASHDELLAAQQQDPGALVLWHFLDVEANERHRDLLDISLLFPGGAIASDAMPWTLPDGSTYDQDIWPLPATASSHPRSSGTFTRFIRRWVRERQAIGLMEALDKCTLTPARILEESTPQMRRKGRIRNGCDADLVVFDLASLTERADFKTMNRPAEGMRHVFVHGASVIENGRLNQSARFGRPVRRTMT
jgi:N-acyl-D-aspartate/D-glutamate deacylase